MATGDLVGGLVDVAQPVRFVDDHQVPGRLPDDTAPWSGRTGRSRG